MMKTDLISMLPKEILHHIISMVSFKEAVQSSTLSTAWRSLLNPFRVNLEAGEEELSHQIIESLAKSGAGFQILNVHLHSSDVAFAVCTRGINGELHLNFSQHHHLKNTFSLIVNQTYTNNSLCNPTLSLVKTLHLRSVSHLVGEMVSDLCSSLPFLETLKLEKCEGLESVEVRCNEDSSLKYFEMSDCTNVVRIVIESAHNLSSFSYKGVFPVIQLLNVPNLVDVALDFKDGLGDNRTFDCEDVIFVLSSLKDIQALQLSSWFIQALCCAGVIFSKLEFQFSRLKDLKLICSKISSKTRDSLACFLHITPTLEELELKIMDEDSRCVEFPFSYQNWHEPHQCMDYATVKNEACRLKYMKRIKMMGFTMEKDELLLMDLLLHFAINLKEMIVDDMWRVARVPYSQLNYIKLKYLFIPCSDIDSHFVLIAVSSPLIVK